MAKDLTQKIVLESEFEGDASKEAKEALKELGNVAEKTTEKTEELTRTSSAFGDELAKITERADDLAGTLGGPSAAAIAETEQELRRLMETTEEGSEEWKKYQSEIERVRGQLDRSKKILVENEVAVEKLTLETQAAIRNQSDFRTELTRGEKGLKGFAVGAGQLGAAFSGGFAVGLGIAKKAGVDLTETMDALDAALTGVAKGLNFLIGKPAEALGDLFNELTGVAGLTEEENRLLQESLRKSEAFLASEKVRREELKKADEAAKAAAIAKAAAEEKAKAELESRAQLSVIDAQNQIQLLGYSKERLAFLEATLLRQAELAATEEERTAATIAALQTIEALRMAEETEQARRAVVAAETELSIQGVRAETLEKFRLAKLAEIEITSASAEDRLAAETALERQIQQMQAASTAQKTATIVGGAKAALGVAAQAFGEQKEIAIAQAIIGTYESAVSAYKSLAVIPIVGPALGAVAAALAVVAGLKNVQQIRASEPAGGGSVSTPAETGGAAPSFDDPANDAAARFAGRQSARDVSGHFGDGFKSELLTGLAHTRAGNTAGPSSVSQASTTINVEGSFATPPDAFVRAFSRDQSRRQAVIESRVSRSRKRVRR